MQARLLALYPSEQASELEPEACCDVWDLHVLDRAVLIAGRQCPVVLENRLQPHAGMWWV